ncbi:MAG: tryptophan synthase subunit alpha [Chloroflexi bacterium]|nr:MAG: tryptophan synthase subunit alpha [Chloroflexota bacterium]
MTRFASTFERLQRDGVCGLFPYLMAGFPDEPTSRALAEAALAAGVDGFEIGVPFSDPLADGTTLQRANARALAGGATLDTALDLARLIRERSPDTPVSLMSYYNPLRQRGDRQVAADFAAAGVDAVIAADLPAEESGELRLALDAEGVALIPLVAPTSPPARIRAMTALQPEWIYCVALVGVTGARQDVSDALGALLDHVRAESSAPLVVGFGISQPDHVRRVARLGAAGVIVASALADLIDRSPEPVPAAAAYLREMKDAAAAVHQP